MSDGRPEIIGYLKTTITHLEMLKPPPGLALQPPDQDLEIVRALSPTVRFYRFLYDGVGGDWLWSSRRRMGDQELLQAISKPTIDIRVLWQSGVPMGYAEMDFRASDDVELAYFGLMPEAIGSGIGRFFLNWTTRHAFSNGAGRFWVHTCDLDHPRALATYEDAGFVAFDREEAEEMVLEGMRVPSHVAGRPVRLV